MSEWVVCVICLVLPEASFMAKAEMAKFKTNTFSDEKTLSEDGLMCQTSCGVLSHELERRKKDKN